LSAEDELSCVILVAQENVPLAGPSVGGMNYILPVDPFLVQNII